MKDLKKSLLIVFFAVALAGFGNGPIVLAEPNSSVLELTPFLIEKDVNRGQVLSDSVVVTNAGPEPRHLIMALQDFLPSGIDGGFEFLPPGKYAPAASGLARWVTLAGQPADVLLPGQSTKVDFQVKIPVEAEAGTHYGGLVFSLQSDYQRSSGSETLQQAAALLILDVDRSFERAEIQSFKFSKIGERAGEMQFLTVVENSGLSSLKPKGRVVIYNWLGKPVATAFVNPDALTVLPKTSRIFVSKIPELKYFGKYRAELTLVYGSKRLEVKGVTSFWVFSWEKVLMYAFLLITASLIIFLLIKRYNQWIIRKSNKSLK